jgi:hypothetical protein
MKITESPACKTCDRLTCLPLTNTGRILPAIHPVPRGILRTRLPSGTSRHPELSDPGISKGATTVIFIYEKSGLPCVLCVSVVKKDFTLSPTLQAWLVKVSLFPDPSRGLPSNCCAWRRCRNFVLSVYLSAWVGCQSPCQAASQG